MLLALTAAFAMAPADTTVTAGPWTFTGQPGRARHSHGGRPAQVSHATFQVTLTEPAPALSVDKVEFLRGHSCDEPPTHVAATLTEAHLMVEGVQTSGAFVTFTPGTHPLTVSFPGQPAYYSWCDRFAVRVTFRSGEHRATAVAETKVVRYEPMRRVRPAP